MEKFSSIKYIRQNLKDLGIDPNIISENKKMKRTLNKIKSYIKSGGQNVYDITIILKGKEVHK